MVNGGSLGFFPEETAIFIVGCGGGPEDGPLVPTSRAHRMKGHRPMRSLMSGLPRFSENRLSRSFPWGGKFAGASPLSRVSSDVSRRLFVP